MNKVLRLKIEKNRNLVEEFKTIGINADFNNTTEEISIRGSKFTKFKTCSNCEKLLKISDMKEHNKYENYNDYFCDECLDSCLVCGELFAYYDYTGKCDSCAD